MKTHLYFAYGSNLWLPQLRSRTPSARSVGTAELTGWAVVYDKPSKDGSSKLNIRPDTNSVVSGVLYEITDDEWPALVEAEQLYDQMDVEVHSNGQVMAARTFAYRQEPTQKLPYDWYVSVATAGAQAAGLPPRISRSDPDPLAPGLAAANPGDLPELQSRLSKIITASGPAYTVHPGDLAWWMYHWDPRRAGLSFWLADTEGVLVVDEESGELSVFHPDPDRRIELLHWGQRRVGGEGEIGWVSDGDEELTGRLRAAGYHPAWTDRTYEWDLNEVDIPEPKLPDGFVLRHLQGEAEADARRTASHAAFASTMDPEAHLERYLGFMRSPVYVAERDLVVEAPDGSIASFMVWWHDASGVAQIEPFGTHPDFQRLGLGRALIYHGLAEMRAAGMNVARVLTDEPRDATDFYEGVGFRDVGRIRWWSPTGESAFAPSI